MPLFKIEARGTNRRMVKADSLSELIDMSIKKLNLNKDITYRVVLQDGTEMEDNDILIEYASQSSNTVVLILLPENEVFENESQENNRNLQNISANSEESNLDGSTRTDNLSPSIAKKATHCIDLHEVLWSKISKNIVKTCETKQQLEPRYKQIISRRVADYMFEDLKDCSRSTAGKIAQMIVEQYPATFQDAIGATNVMIGNGFETLRLQIYNACRYKLSVQSVKRKRISINCDSDDEEQENREKEAKLLRMQDQYGCVEYAPILPENETPDIQQEKRKKLINIFNTNLHDKEVDTLLHDTYPTLRAHINARDRNLEQISIDWPFIKDPGFLKQHASRLLGKNINDIWETSVSKLLRIIRQYFKYSMGVISLKHDSKIKITKTIEEYKEAANICKSNIPKLFAVFRLLIQYFGEKEDMLFKIVNVDTPDEELTAEVKSDYPILLIKGQSMYDEKAVVAVIINKSIQIFCSDIIEGILIGFLNYYIFGYCYPPGIEKTMEFIQRVLLRINPASGGSGGKGLSTKRRQKSFDTSVYNLAKALTAFSDEFNIHN